MNKKFYHSQPLRFEPIHFSGFRQKAVTLGIIDPSWEWLLTPLEYDPNILADLQDRLARIEAFMESLFLHYRPSIREIMLELGIPTWMYDFILLDNSDVPFPLRWDVICTGDTWQIIEVNTGYCLGGLNGYAINSIRSNFYELTCPDNPITPIQNPFREMRRNLSTIVKRHEIVPIVETPEGYGKYGFYLKNFVKLMNQKGNTQFVAGTLCDFDFTDSQATFKGYPVNVFIPMFNLYEVAGDTSLMASFRQALLTKRLTSALGFREVLFSNKGFIAWLTKNIGYITQPEARDYFNSLFPLTNILTRQNCEVFWQGDYVLKPAEGYGGAGIVCSWLCEPAEWYRSLQQALDSGKCWIVQKRVYGEMLPMQSIDRNAQIKQGNASVVHGFITLRGKMIGTLTRAAIGISNPGVINAHQGAAFGLTGLDVTNT
ncbi:hypothetical protein [Photorhabdus sp. CRCIA-P01]|uniref:hypothetical protein n=1 Tax=Photorhabdus sp. CRCIA-P01 TaxID=2019570 RepID=UPI000E59F2A4|nr:hypothetical protein [Photorhabdus sp. CRCIA-P01]